MLVRFWGTRGSIARPGLSTVRYGGNTSCTEVRSSGGTLMVLDCGTGALGLGQALVRNRVSPINGHMLIGHTHWDHIQGFPFFAPLFISGNEWHIYGPRGVDASLRESLSGQMQYSYFPVTLDDLGATLHYHDLVEGTLEVGDIRITTRYLNHPALTLGYRLEADGASVVYCTDHEAYSPHRPEESETSLAGEEARHAQFISGADLLIHDAQYTSEEYAAKKGWGHSTPQYAVDSAISAGVRRLALFHHDPMRTDEAIDALVARARERAASAKSMLEIFAAAEGQVIELERSATPARSPEPKEQTARWDSPLAPSRRSVLVAVGDPELRRFLEEAVANDGVRLIPVGDCEAVSALVKSEQPSLVLVESALKSCDAVRLARALREDPSASARDLPIVVLKKRGNPGERERESAAGITDWLILPCSKEYARTRIHAWLLRVACRWKNAPQPEDEESRLRRLRASGLLDTAPEERFDRVTRIAAALFEVPIAFISLVDRERQWFKSRTGIDATETPRDQAFCAHAILRNDIMQVTDAHADERFADNPLVTRGPRVRFYAGAPLSLGEGSPVGTLCVVDHRPRSLDEDQLKLLRDLSKLVERELVIGSS
jgi:phosphoribosyl 1,2-cyclic phosphodiesterase/CheY-like chemotaxis protein